MLSVISWRYAVQAPETILKVIAVVKTAIYGNLGDGIICCQQHLTGLTDSNVIQVILKGYAGYFPEFFGKISGA